MRPRNDEDRPFLMRACRAYARINPLSGEGTFKRITPVRDDHGRVYRYTMEFSVYEPSDEPGDTRWYWNHYSAQLSKPKVIAAFETHLRRYSAEALEEDGMVAYFEMKPKSVEGSAGYRRTVLDIKYIFPKDLLDPAGNVIHVDVKSTDGMESNERSQS